MGTDTIIIAIVISSFVLPIIGAIIAAAIFGTGGGGETTGSIIPKTDPWYKNPLPDVNPPAPEHKEQKFDHTLETMIGYELVKKVWE